MTFLSHLECSKCGKEHDADEVQSVCVDCAKPLLCRYDWESVCGAAHREDLPGRPADMWRYREILPIRKDDNIVSLGEGMTPLLPAPRLGRRLGLKRLFVKDESQIPTGSFKARGMSVAVSRAKELGVNEGAVPSAGNAGGALAAYAARAGMRAHIFMPTDVPLINRLEAEAAGAQVVLVDGLISDCGKRVAQGKAEHGWFDFSTLKEPYRLEGKKTMGFEVAEQLGWSLPDVIIYPTGGGTGLVGMWKAFEEMETIAWIGGRRPRMVTVQSAGCAPIVRAFEEGAEDATPWEGAETIAAGLRVPSAIADFLMLKVLRESRGTAVAVSDDEILRAMREMASAEGIVACPEGAATLAAAKRLKDDGMIGADERVVLFNTGSGLKYPEAMKAAGVSGG